MKARLIEAGETLVGILWWGSVWVWGSLMSVMFILVPLLLANMAVLIRESLPATLALVAGVVGAYLINLPPWDAGDIESLPLVVGGTAVAVVVWDLMRGSADVVTLLVALGVAAIGWLLRRSISRRRRVAV